MAFEAIFDKIISGTGTTTVKEDWYEVMLIPTGKKVWPGFGSFTSWDKQLSFELRANKPGQSAGTLVATDKLDMVGVSAGAYALMDIFKSGLVSQKTAPMTALSTGVEKLWLRVVGSTNAAGVFDWQLDYSELTE